MCVDDDSIEFHRTLKTSKEIIWKFWLEFLNVDDDGL